MDKEIMYLGLGLIGLVAIVLVIRAVTSITQLNADARVAEANYEMINEVIRFRGQQEQIQANQTTTVKDWLSTIGSVAGAVTGLTSGGG